MRAPAMEVTNNPSVITMILAAHGGDRHLPTRTHAEQATQRYQTNTCWSPQRFPSASMQKTHEHGGCHDLRVADLL
jgi:hypothetical protein